MITLTDCMRAISGALEAEFGAAPVTKDIREGFQRPATFLQPTDVTCAMEGLIRHDTYRFEIIRFSEEDYKGYIDLLAYQERLRALLAKPIRVDGGSFQLFPDETDFEIIMGDYALVAGFEVENFQIEDQYADPDDPPKMLIFYENGQCVVPPAE